jgi:hypothetical protein
MRPVSRLTPKPATRRPSSPSRSAPSHAGRRRGRPAQTPAVGTRITRRGESDGPAPTKKCGARREKLPLRPQRGCRQRVGSRGNVPSGNSSRSRGRASAPFFGVRAPVRALQHDWVMLRLASAIVVLVGAGSSACSSLGDPCSLKDGDAVTCEDGSSLKQCVVDPEFNFRWHVVPCGAPNPFCATKSDGTGVCSASRDRAPECAANPSAFSCATPTEVHSCKDGFLLVLKCDATGTDAKSCVSSLQLAESFCALSTTRDPRCTLGETQLCDGNTLIDCADGYALDTHSCTQCAYSQSTHTASCR